MSAHSRATLAALVMTCTAVTSTGRAAQQSPPQGAVRIAYRQCWMDFDGGGVRVTSASGSMDPTRRGHRRRSAEMVARRYTDRLCRRQHLHQQLRRSRGCECRRPACHHIPHNVDGLPGPELGARLVA